MRPHMEPVLHHLPASGTGPGTPPAPTLARRRPAAGSVTAPALATIGAEIPAVIATPAALRDAALLAQWLLAANALPVPRHRLPPGALAAYCQSTLQHRLQGLCGPLRCLSPSFEMAPLTFEEMPPMADPAASTDEPGRLAGVRIVWRMTAVAHWGVGAGLDYLEQTVPQLGATVLHALETKGAQVCPLFTPRVLMDEACGLYWLGEEDESMFLDEECGDDAAAREAMLHDMVTRDDVERAFPPWAFAPGKFCLSRRALHTVASTHACPYVREAAQLTSALRRQATTGRYLPQWDDPFIGYGAVLCWRDGDLAVQVSDDCANLAWQGESCDIVGDVTLPLSEPAALRAWLAGMAPNLRAIGLIDRLLWHLSARE